MFMRLVQFTLSEGARTQAQAMADELISAIKQQQGCQSAVFFGGGTDGESGICVLWDSREHADAASTIISPRLGVHLSGNVTGPVERRLFPVMAN